MGDTEEDMLCGDIPKNLHYKHHMFISDLIEKDEKKEAVKQQVISSIIVSAVLSVMSGIGATIWYAITTFIHTGGSK